MDNSIYEKLRKCIDQYTVGFNTTKTGIEIKLLKKIFTYDEAEMYLNLTRKLEPVTVIAKRIGKRIDETALILEGMFKKGLLFPRKKGDEMYYSAAPFMHGFFENQALTVMDKELAEMYEQYLTGGFFPKTAALKTVPVNITLNNKFPILPFDDVKKIIQSKKRIGVTKCACATKMMMLETGCKKSAEVCIAFDYYAEYGIEYYGIGRWITKEEALKILEYSEKIGLVHQIGGNSANIECICNCCSDCCVSLRIYKLFPQPAKIGGSNYFAQAVTEKCNQCKACINRCPMNAISLADKGVKINLDRCIGCGLCTSGCSMNAILLQKKPDQEIRGPLPPDQYKFFRSSIDFDKDLE